jgi:hypothetical protein
MWQEKGIAAFDYSSNSQPPWTSYHFIREAYKRQKPRIVVMDVVMIAAKISDNDYDPPIRQIVYSTFPQSINRLNMIRAGAEKEQQIPLIIDLIQYHARWRNISKDSLPYLKQDYLNTNLSRYKGFRLVLIKANISSGLNDKFYPSTNEEAEIPERNLYYLQRIMDLSKENGFELLLIKTPDLNIVNNENEEKKYNTIRRIAEENSVPFIDYNYKEHMDAIRLDFTIDLWDATHLNVYGAEKFSRYIGAYLKAEYNLPDRRGDPLYKSWDESAEGYFRYEAMEKAKQNTDLLSYLDAINEVSQNLIFITSVRGDASAKIESIANLLSPLGITIDLTGKNNNSFICVYEPSSGYLYEEDSASKKLMKNIYKEGLPINVEAISAGNGKGDEARIKIDGKECAKNKRGLNIVIYDKVLDTVFDSFYVDTHEDENFTIGR